MKYGYRCPTCGDFRSAERADAILCGECGLPAKRDWRFHLDYSFEPYFAPSFGCVVNSRSHARDLTKIASEEQSARLGFDVDLQLVDTHDDAAVGIDTDEKLHQAEQTRRFVVSDAAFKAKELRERDERRARNRQERKRAAAEAGAADETFQEAAAAAVEMA
jgi:hypothetical protein